MFTIDINNLCGFQGFERMRGCVTDFHAGQTLIDLADLLEGRMSVLG